jgi:YHS domain-containing protein
MAMAASLEQRRNGMNMIGKATVRAAGVAFALLAFTPLSHAQDAEVVNTGYFGDVAIRGYDPVAYFTENKAVEGSEKFSHNWLGATWHFASAQNRDLFVREPLKYAPQYGGLCADGVSLGTVTTNIDPKAWRIIDGKLYLNYDPGAADGFAKNPTKVIDSQKYWPEVKQTLVAEKRQLARR